MALWKAVADRYDLLVATWDSGRVGPTELERLSTLVWGRLDAPRAPPAPGCRGNVRPGRSPGRLAARGLPAVRRAGRLAAGPAGARPRRRPTSRPAARSCAPRSNGSATWSTASRPGPRRRRRGARPARHAASPTSLARATARRRRGRAARAAGEGRRPRRARPDRRRGEPRADAARRGPGPGAARASWRRAAPRCATWRPGAWPRSPRRRGSPYPTSTALGPVPTDAGRGRRLPGAARRRRPGAEDGAGRVRRGPGRAGRAAGSRWRPTTPRPPSSRASAGSAASRGRPGRARAARPASRSTASQSTWCAARAARGGLPGLPRQRPRPAAATPGRRRDSHERDACTQPGCTGTILDGYCDVCGVAGRAPAPGRRPADRHGAIGAAVRPVRAAGLHRHDRRRLLRRLRLARPAGPAPGGRAGAAAEASPTMPPAWPVAVDGLAGVQPARLDRARLGARGRAAPRSPAGSARVDPAARRPARRRPDLLPPSPAVDAAKAIMANPRSPRTGGPARTAASPVGRSRAGQPGRTEGFCPKCRTPFSFTPKLQRGRPGRRPVRGGRRLAHGGLGWIYLARDRNVSDRWVVLKGLLNSGDPDALAAAIAERQFLAQVEHPLIVEIYNFVTHDGAGYIVMEYVGGKSLKKLLKERMAANRRRVRPAAGRPGDRLHPRDPARVPVPARPRPALLRLQAGQHHPGRRRGQAHRPRRRAPHRRPRLRDLRHGRLPGARGAGGRPVGRLRHLHDRPHADRARDGVPRLPEHLRRVAAAGRRAPLFQQYDSLYRLLLKACAPDPADRFVSADELRVQLLGVLREVVARRTRGRGRALDVVAALRRRRRSPTTSLDWQDLPSLRIDDSDPQMPLAADRRASTTRSQRLAALEDAPAISRRGAAGGRAAALEAGQLRRVDDAVGDAARRRPVGVARGLDVRAGRPRRGRRPRRSARSTPSTARCRASWRRSWRSRSPARPAARPTSPRGSTSSAPAPTRTTSRRPRSGWPGSARTAATSPAPSPPSTWYRGPAGRSSRPPPAGRLLAGSGGGLPSLAEAMRQHRGPDHRPVDRSALPRRGAQRGAGRGASSTARTRPCAIAGRPATEPALRDGLEAAYRELAGQATSREERVAPGRPGQRGAPLDAAMTRTDADGPVRPSAADERRTAERVLCEVVREPGRRRRALLRGLRRRPGPPTGDRRRRAPPTARPGAPQATSPGLPRVRRRGRRRRLLHAVRGARRRARATTSPSSRPPGWRRLRPRDPAQPQRGRDGARGRARAGRPAPCSSSATASPRRPTPTSPAWPPPGPPATCWPRRSRRGIGHRRHPASRRARRPSSLRPTRPTTRCSPHDRPDAGQPGVVHVRGRRRRRLAARRGLGRRQPRVLAARRRGGPAADRRRLVGRRADRPACRGRGRDRAAGARDHPLAGHRRARPHTAHACRSTSTARAGCSSARTGSGTTAPRRSDLAGLVATTSRAAGDEPLALAGALVDWANAQGGQDNITVALARVGPAWRRHRRTAQPIADGTQPAHREEVQTDGHILSRGLPERVPARRRHRRPRHRHGHLHRRGRGRAVRRGDAAEIIIVDTSGSMSGENIAAASVAAAAALDEILDGTWFAVIAGSHQALPGLPAGRALAMVRMDATTRAAGQGRGGRVPGPTAAPRSAPGSTLATRLFARCRARPSGTRSCSPTATTRTRARSSSAPRSRPPGAGSSATAAASARLAGGRGAPDRHRAARHRRPHRRSPQQMAADFEQIMRQRWAAASPTPRCGCGPRRAPRCCSCARSRRPSRTSRPGARRSTR